MQWNIKPWEEEENEYKEEKSVWGEATRKFREAMELKSKSQALEKYQENETRTMNKLMKW